MALSTAAEIEELADKLKDSANSMQEKIVTASREGTITLAEAQHAFDQVLMLQQEASGLYINAITLILSDLQTPQAELMIVIDESKAKIESIDRIEKGLVIVAKLLTLATQLQSADAKGFLATTKELRSLV